MGIGGGAGISSFPDHLKMAHAALLTGIDPVNTPDFDDYDTSLVMYDKLIEASSDIGGSPYVQEAYDPDTDLDAVQDMVDSLKTIVDALDPSTEIDSAMTKAVDVYDNTMQPTSHIDDVINASKNYGKAAHLEDVSRIYVGFYDIRGVLSSQLPIAVALAEHQRELRATGQENQLRILFDRQRTEALMSILGHWLSEHREKTSANERATGIQEAVARNRIIAKNDQWTADLDVLVRDALWDLELFGYAGNLLASSLGAAQMPRAQTQRERVLSAAMSSISVGVQGGMATGSYGGGFATGGIALLTQLWALG